MKDLEPILSGTIVKFSVDRGEGIKLNVAVGDRIEEVQVAGGAVLVLGPKGVHLEGRKDPISFEQIRPGREVDIKAVDQSLVKKGCSKFSMVIPSKRRTN